MSIYITTGISDSHDNCRCLETPQAFRTLESAVRSMTDRIIDWLDENGAIHDGIIVLSELEQDGIFDELTVALMKRDSDGNIPVSAFREYTAKERPSVFYAATGCEDTITLEIDQVDIQD